MKKSLLVFSILLLAVLSVSLIAARESTDEAGNSVRPDVPTYGVGGEYAVGYQSFTLEDDEMPRIASIWYPTAAPDNAEANITYDLGVGDLMPPMFNTLEGHAYQDAAPFMDDGPYPLIVYSHGYGGPYMVSAYQFEHLASHGFVVYAFVHRYDSLRAAALFGAEESYLNHSVESMVMRLLDISKAIDYVENINMNDNNLAGIIDMENIGVYGMSYGGYTAVMESGIRFDFSEVDNLCDEKHLFSVVAQIACNVFAGDVNALETDLASVANVEIQAGELWPTLADPRVDAVSSLSPAPLTSLISDEGLAEADKPIMMQYGTADTTEVAAQRTWDTVSSPTKILVAFENASHLFGVECTEGMWQVYQPCYDPVWDTQRAHDLSNHFTTAFFLSQLKGDADATAALQDDAVDFVGIDYQATIEN